MRGLGGNQEVLESIRQELEAEEDDGSEIWPCNQRSFDIFAALETQWLWTGNMDRTRRTGLNYPGVESHLCIMKIKHKKQVWKDIKVMELAALEVFGG